MKRKKKEEKVKVIVMSDVLKHVLVFKQQVNQEKIFFLR